MAYKYQYQQVTNMLESKSYYISNVKDAKVISSKFHPSAQ